MKVLVLGPNGQLGTDLIRNSSQAPLIEWIPFGREKLDLSGEFEEIIPRLLEARADVLVNCAGDNRVDEAEEKSEKTYRLNAHAVGEIAKACQKKKIRMIHNSTDYVFDGEKKKAYHEEDFPAPINLYGASKWAGELLARRYHDNVVILRTASLYGQRGSTSKGHNFVQAILKQAHEKKPIRVVQDVTMSPTSSEQLAEVIIKILDQNPPSGVYHAVNSGHASWYEFARKIIEFASVPAEIVPVTSVEFKRAARRPPMSVLDNSKISSRVGPIPHWEEALELYLKRKGLCR